MKEILLIFFLPFIIHRSYFVVSDSFLLLTFRNMRPDLRTLSAMALSLNDAPVYVGQAGVREQVQADDASSHYDLGMTYRQMGLLDEAVAEFRLSARDPAFSVKCTDILGRCLLERENACGAATCIIGGQLVVVPQRVYLPFAPGVARAGSHS